MQHVALTCYDCLAGALREFSSNCLWLFVLHMSAVIGQCDSFRFNFTAQLKELDFFVQ